jgi:nitrite reductase/ring-hydroxylating ferredoxin subunit
MSGWVAVAGSGTIGPRGRIRVVVDEAEYVLWRGASGAIRLWGNRCPHRGMRLSFGLVRGEDLFCIYHGWRYEPSGRCAAIPAHPDLDPPKTIAAEVHRVAEAHGLVWFGGEGDAPDLSALAGGRPLAFCRSVHIDRPVAHLRSALADGLPGWRAAAGPNGTLVLEGPGATAVAAFHAPEGARSAVHVSVAAETADLRVALARALAAFRDRMEGEAA